MLYTSDIKATGFGRGSKKSGYQSIRVFATLSISPSVPVIVFRQELIPCRCNDPIIGSYNNYDLSPNDILRSNQRWYGVVSIDTRMLVRLGQGLGNSRVALGTLLGRVTIWENIRIRSRELWKCYTDLRDDSCGRLEDWRSG